jgi:hypothetical protein
MTRDDDGMIGVRALLECPELLPEECSDAGHHVVAAVTIHGQGIG